jgi:aldose 1-epimerase
VLSIHLPDRDGRMADVLLGYEHFTDYLHNPFYLGCVVGRFANRIAEGRFTIEEREFELALNNEDDGVASHLHGGFHGLGTVAWESEPVRARGRRGVRFHHRSPDGTEGYPGNLDVTVYYWLTDDNELCIEFEATTDQPTPVNLTNHCTFNLAGHDRGAIHDHVLTIEADAIAAIDSRRIPTGDLLPVDETPFDFRQPTPVGLRIGARHEQIARGTGYDHSFAVRDWDATLRRAATLYEPGSGRRLEVLTTEPALHFYSGNFLDSQCVAKGQGAYARHAGLALEAQHFPDSPNQPEFPSTVLRPGERYHQITVYRFSAT